MRVAVVVFPGSNCERDVRHALLDAGAEVDMVWHTEPTLANADAVVLPGGFAHGDYLRTGAVAARSPVMGAVREMADAGAPVLGICNGFQVLCEAGMLPGALIANESLRFICRMVHVRVDDAGTVLTDGCEVGDVLSIPLNSYEGNWVGELGDARVALRYCDADGTAGDEANPNGSTDNIAAIANAAGNVVGVMPHPERAVAPHMASVDGLALIRSLVSTPSPAHV